MSKDYNVIVLGAGSAGLVSAYIAAAVKAKVLLIERHKMGGDCLNTGCVPSKTLIKTAKFVHNMRRHKALGVKDVTFELDLGEVMDRVAQAIKTIEPHDSVERYESLGVHCLRGQAELIDQHTVQVENKTFTAKSIILAMGASPFVPPIKGLERIKYRTSENLWEMRHLPKRFIVLGGGPIGTEMAQAFSRLGSKVTQVEMADRILGREDLDVADFMAEHLKAEGVNILTGTKATHVDQKASGENLLMCEKKDGSVEAIPFDEILVAVGRRANTGGQPALQTLGIKQNPDGTLKTDAYLRLNGSNIYGCGDLVGPYQFTHTASHQAWFCAVNALFDPLKKFKVDYRVIPWVTFTDPEIAHVGHSERSAVDAGVEFEKTTYSIAGLDRAIAESENHGFVKVLTRPGSDKIIGATIVSHNAGEMIAEFVAAMKHNFGLNKILGTIHSYPTYVEANKYAAGNWKKAHAPEQILKYLEKVHHWRL